MSNVCLLFGTPRIKGKESFLAKLRDVQNEYKCVILALDADKVAGEKHAIFAAEKALRAVSENRNVAKNIGVEIMRYASGQRQIERALSMGISDTTSRIALILVENGTKPDLSGVIDLDGRGPSWNPKAVRETFNIGDEEIEAVGEDKILDLVLERVALVDAYR